MLEFTVKATDKGFLGDISEMTWKWVLDRPNWAMVSPAGKADFRFNNHNYDVKQNGSVLQYSPNERYIKGSNRVIYATHVEHTIVDNGDGTVTVSVDLAASQWFVLDRKEFIDFLQSINGLKYNAQRQQVNIQTCYNYKKDAYHGSKGKKIEEWAYAHDIDDDDIIGRMMERLG